MIASVVWLTTKNGAFQRKPNTEKTHTVRQPKGWTKSTVGMWTTVLDDKGNLILTQFYKGSLYDQRAFVDIVKQPANTLERLVEFVEDKIL